MTHVRIGLRTGDCQEIEAFLAARLYDFNARATGCFDGESFGAVRQDDAGQRIAGIAGYTWGGCGYVSHLWVAEGQRGAGLGRALLQAAEANARDRGCSLMLLATHSFQAPGFYAHLGYVEQARLMDHPLGHASVFFAKRLAPASQDDAG